jgi:hypothetical protein
MRTEDFTTEAQRHRESMRQMNEYRMILFIVFSVSAVSLWLILFMPIL